MRKQDKYKVILEANQRLERDYLIAKNIIMEDVDDSSFKNFMEQLASNYKFNLNSGNNINLGLWSQELGNNPEKYLGDVDKKNQRYEKEGYIYVGVNEYQGKKTYNVWVSSSNKALVKSIQDSFIKNYSKFTSGEISQKAQQGVGVSVKIDPKDEDAKIFFNTVGDLVRKNDGQLIGTDVRLANVMQYVSNKGMEGKELYVGLIPEEGISSAGFNQNVVSAALIMVYTNDELFNKFTGSLTQKFNKLSKPNIKIVKDPEGNEVKIGLIPLRYEDITEKETNKGSMGTNAVDKKLVTIKTKDEITLWTPSKPIYVQ